MLKQYKVLKDYYVGEALIFEKGEKFEALTTCFSVTVKKSTKSTTKNCTISGSERMTNYFYKDLPEFFEEVRDPKLPALGEQYFYVENVTLIGSKDWNDDKEDFSRYNVGNAFIDYNECQELIVLIGNAMIEQREKRKVRNLETLGIIELLAIKNYHVKEFTDYQYRVEGKVDVYPKSRKYHIVCTGRRGVYKDNAELLEILSAIISTSLSDI